MGLEGEPMRGEQAAERARSARVRADDLAARLTSLRDGPSRDESTYSTEAAAVAAGRAAVALSLSAAAHRRAADLHRRFAELWDEFGYLDRAIEQRRLAALDDAAGSADEALARGSR
jgi:hypothetical protein